MITDEAVERLEALGKTENARTVDVQRAKEEAVSVVLLHCEERVRMAYHEAVQRIEAG